jgi:uncharacterized protein YgfB (UPF0149 family)
MMHVTFPEVVRVLERSGSSVSAAEGHGCLCGALCTTAEYPLERWLDEIVPEAPDDTDEAAAAALRLLFTDTVRSLRGDEMEFEPLIPDDDAALESRAAALAQWCQGFLYGFGTGQPVKPEQIPASVGEILRDLTHIGRASVEVGESGEEEEQAYAEIVEYVRVGVQLIHDELVEARASRDSSRAS